MSEYFDKATIGGIDIPCTDANAQGRLSTLEGRFDSNGKVLSANLPSYVDDVIEGYLKAADGKFYEESTYTTEITGETGKIYVNLSNNKSYRWGGSAFVEISSSDVTGITIGSGGTNYTPSQGVITIPAYEAGAQVHIAPTTAEVKSALGTVTTSEGKFLKDNGTWDTPTGTTYEFNTTYNASTNKAATMADIPSALPASDVSAWAKAASKPSYAYSEIGYTTATASDNSNTSGAITLDGAKPLHVIALTGAATSVAFTLGKLPEVGHSCHVIFTAATATTVTLSHIDDQSVRYICPAGEDPDDLEVPAGGYVEIDFLRAPDTTESNNTINWIYVRGI